MLMSSDSLRVTSGGADNDPERRVNFCSEPLSVSLYTENTYIYIHHYVAIAIRNEATITCNFVATQFAMHAYWLIACAYNGILICIHYI